ncbi:MAG: Holliday junction branch migration protein RuvA [Lachnospiraceae bacterium]|nr:Holliday junction branch migration protein RuvA [Lachnospiraceae bacterium]
MISYIKGTVEDIGDDYFVLESHDIGYRIFAPGSVLNRLPAKGTEIKVHTYFKVSEDAIQLYGFLDKETKNLFLMLLSVNSVGPKAALSILSVFSAEDVRFAIVSGDSKTISRAPGIGTKTAQRIILDLKDKLDAAEVVEDKLSGGVSTDIPTGTPSVKTDAIAALTALGYSQTDAYKAVSKATITESTTVEDLLKEALKELAFI